MRSQLDICYDLASSQSRDPRTQNGALVVLKSGVAYGGVNNVPAFVEEKPGMIVSPGKYLWMEHAERAAIYSAVSFNANLYESTMYCPWAACADCARAIAMSGIKRLVRHKQAMERKMDEASESKWKESILIGDAIMDAAGVEVVDYDYVPWHEDTKVLFSGEYWYPSNP